MERTTQASLIAAACKQSRAVQAFRRGLVTILVLPAMSAHAWSAEGAGTIKTLAGSGTVIRGAEVVPISTGQRVFPGDRIVSSKNSYIGFMLHDDTRVTIGPGSELLIREFEFNPNSAPFQCR